MKWNLLLTVLSSWLAMHLGACRLATPSAEDYVLVGGSGESGASTGGEVGEGESSSSGGMQSDGGTGEGSTTAGTDGSSAGASTDGMETDTGAEVICGDGLVEGDEACDGMALQGETCQSQGFDGGMLGCTADCSSLDLGGCGTCGNAVIDGDEICDGPALGGLSCESEGFESGPLACAADCLSLDPSGCGVCGNGMIDGDEACDGIDLGGQTCGPGFDSGTLACLADCSAFDFGACGTCGNAVIDGNEVCDGTELPGHTCVSEGFDSGALACATDCGSFVTGGCGACGNDVIDGDEVCDGVDVGGHTCVSQGFDSGMLGCDGGCGAFDTAGCYTCGDGVVSPPVEQCDGGNLGGATCVSQGFDGGTLGCDAACAYAPSGCAYLPDVPVLSLGFSPVKRFDFGWAAVAGADYYQLEESAAPGEPFVPLGGEVVGVAVSHEMPLHLRWQASYRLLACSAAGCTESAVVDVVGSLAEAVGYVKASNTNANDEYGWSVALSGDGNTLAVGTWEEDSSATGVGGNSADDSTSNSGAVYVYTRDEMGAWSQQAYVKASNTGVDDGFGYSVALSGDGDTLAVGARGEGSSATGIDGDQSDDSLVGAGAVYVFVRDPAGQWAQQAYVKASNSAYDDNFGDSLVLSADGDTLAVAAPLEDSDATGIDGDQTNDLGFNSGAVYVFVRDPMQQWSQQAYVKASIRTGRLGSDLALSADGDTLAAGARFENGGTGAAYVFVRDAAGQWSQQGGILASNAVFVDFFGISVALSGDGDTLAVGAYWEDSNATGIDGNQADNSASNSGAAYVFVRDASDQWAQQAYVKASNTQSGDAFGFSVALDDGGDLLVVGAFGEGSGAVGIGGDQTNNSGGSGAAYVFVRDSMDQWAQRAYVKASNTEAGDGFVRSIALSGDGNTLAIGASGEDGSAIGLGGSQADNAAPSAGAAYLY